MPLAYAVTEPLTIPPDQFNADGLAVLTAHGSRYGGEWVMGIMGAAEVVLGEINTVADDRPSMAVDSAYVFINDTCVRSGLKIVKFENLNDRYPPDQAPYFALARFVVADKDWI